MATLPRLKPRLQTLGASRVPVLQAKAGSTPRQVGGSWTATRKRIALKYEYRCVDCNRVWVPEVDHIDHDTPLEQGGSNDDSNLRPRCVECHAAKTKREAGQRAGKL